LGLPPAVIELNRNPINAHEVRKCLKKSFDVEAALQRRSLMIAILKVIPFLRS
jgi:hypothetical protein